MNTALNHIVPGNRATCVIDVTSLIMVISDLSAEQVRDGGEEHEEVIPLIDYCICRALEDAWGISIEQVNEPIDPEMADGYELDYELLERLKPLAEQLRPNAGYMANFVGELEPVADGEGFHYEYGVYYFRHGTSVYLTTRKPANTAAQIADDVKELMGLSPEDFKEHVSNICEIMTDAADDQALETATRIWTAVGQALEKAREKRAQPNQPEPLRKRLQDEATIRDFVKDMDVESIRHF